LWVTLPRGRYELMQATMELQTPLLAPVSPEEAVGRLRLTLEGESLAERQLYPLARVAEGGLLRRALHSVQLWFE
jgi:D-alanyl-D-alanine carboxypeptidase (penicillin-binding protein 5/6)